MIINPNIINAKILRKNMTPWERKLWYCFLKTFQLKFRRQQLLENYIVDFYCPKIKLIIELDGSGHYEESAILQDKKRDRVLEESGFFVLRFLNSEIDNKFEDVCNKITKTVEKLENKV